MSSPQVPSTQSTAEKFYRYFQNELSALQEQIGHLEQHSVSGGERNDAIDHCSAGIARLTAEVRDVIDSLPAYDRQTYNDALKALSNKFQAVKTQLAHKQKFSFKHSAFKVHKNGSAMSLHDAAELAEARHNERSPPNEPATKDDGHLQISTTSAIDTSNARLGQGPSDPSSSSHSNSISQLERQVVIGSGPPPSSISQLSQVVLDLSKCDMGGGPLQTLRMNDISRSIIICPRVTGPVHITNVSHSTIAVDCRQFRLHLASDTDVYLHCSSRPIIEDCNNTRFAPADAIGTLVNGFEGDNLWDNVDDFQWLKAGQSPHWSVLPASKRLPAAYWANISAAVTGSDPNALLQG